MNLIELMILAVVGTHLGAALYHEIQRLKPIVSNTVKTALLHHQKRVEWREREHKSESKHFK